MSIESTRPVLTGFSLGRLFQPIIGPAVAIVIAVIVGGVLVALLGQNPIEVYWTLINGSLVGWPNLSVALQMTTPLIFTGLAVAVSFRAGLWNIGAEGQMLVGALLLALPAGTWTWLASIFALAIGSSGISVAAAALADRVEPDRLGHELGVFRLLGDLGLLVGPAVSAFLYQEVDARSAALAAAAVFAIAVVTTLVWVRGTRGPSAAEPALAG